MAKLRTISKRTVDGLSAGDKDAMFRDRELPGFGVRPPGAKAYVVQCRAEGESRRIGRHGVISSGPAQGGARHCPRGAKLRNRRLRAGSSWRRSRSGKEAAHCKPSSAKLCRRALDKFVLPAYGVLAVEAVEREHV